MIRADIPEKALQIVFFFFSKVAFPGTRKEEHELDCSLGKKTHL